VPTVIERQRHCTEERVEAASGAVNADVSRVRESTKTASELLALATQAFQSLIDRKKQKEKVDTVKQVHYPQIYEQPTRNQPTTAT
jgi:hypothetical protein